MSKNCRICSFTRIFLIFVVFLIVISLTLTDKLHYLSIVSTWNVALFIIFVGIIGFIFKLFLYLKKQKLSISDKSD